MTHVTLARAMAAQGPDGPVRRTRALERSGLAGRILGGAAAAAERAEAAMEALEAPRAAAARPYGIGREPLAGVAVSEGMDKALGQEWDGPGWEDALGRHDAARVGARLAAATEEAALAYAAGDAAHWRRASAARIALSVAALPLSDILPHRAHIDAMCLAWVRGRPDEAAAVSMMAGEMDTGEAGQGADPWLLEAFRALQAGDADGARRAAAQASDRRARGKFGRRAAGEAGPLADAAAAVADRSGPRFREALMRLDATMRAELDRRLTRWRIGRQKGAGGDAFLSVPALGLCHLARHNACVPPRSPFFDLEWAAA